jgi:Protein of unknown function (DUF2849)
MSEIITANRLIDGVVVFQETAGGWAEDFARAAIYEGAEATKAGIALARQAELADIVVEPYAIVVELRNGHYAPKALREAIRATGPTVRLDLGKQALGQAPIVAINAHAEKSHVSL